MLGAAVYGMRRSKNYGTAVRINGETVPKGPDCRRGVIIDTDGTPTLGVWLRMGGNVAYRSLLELSEDFLSTLPDRGVVAFL